MKAEASSSCRWVLTTFLLPGCVYTEDLTRSSALVTMQKPGHPVDPWSLCAPSTVIGGHPPPPITALHPSLLCLPFCLPFAPSRPSILTSTPFLTHQPPPSSPRSYPTALPSHSIPKAVHTEAYCVCRETAEGTRERDGAKKQTQLSFPDLPSHKFTAVNSAVFHHIAWMCFWRQKWSFSGPFPFLVQFHPPGYYKRFQLGHFSLVTRYRAPTWLSKLQPLWSEQHHIVPLFPKVPVIGSAGRAV